MDIRIFQMNVIAGDPEENYKNIKNFVDKNMDADLLVLPEMCVGGYLVGDEWNRQDFAEWIESYNEKIKNLSSPLQLNDTKPVSIVWGNIAIDHNKKNEDGRVRKYNAAWAAYNGEFIERKLSDKYLPPYQAKTLMPNYRFFDDKRYFSSFEQYAKEELNEFLQDPFSSVFVPFEIPTAKEGTYKVGLQVCEDMWYSDYDINPTEGYAMTCSDAELIINVSASPWTWNKEKARANVVKKLAQKIENEMGVQMPPIYYANIVGAQNNGKNIITFDGRSSVYNSQGALIQEDRNIFEESVVCTEFPIKKDLFVHTKKPNNERIKCKEKLKAIETGLMHISKYSNQKWIIGLSGGIDSCVSAAILVRTFGADNVIGVNMPTKYNSKKTKNIAKELAKKLGIRYLVVPIEKAIKAKRKSIARNDFSYLPYFEKKSVNEENEQARMRGMILADIAAVYDGLFVNNGNKVETTVGYATLYGDIAGAIAPLADLTKEEVYQMAKYLNSFSPYIPNEVILDKNFSDDRNKVSPSAELKDNQTDPLKFGFMCRIIENGIMDYKKNGIESILQSWLDRTIIEDFDLDKDLFYKYSLHEGCVFVDEINFIFGKLRGTTFKRVQSPPTIITSKSGFGYDYRESILPYKLSEKALKLMAEIQQDRKYY